MTSSKEDQIADAMEALFWKSINAHHPHSRESIAHGLRAIAKSVTEAAHRTTDEFIWEDVLENLQADAERL